MSDTLVKIKTALMSARKNKDPIARTLLTTLVGEIDTLQRKSNNAVVDVEAVVVTFIKNANDTIAHLPDGDTKQNLITEVKILQTFLPQKLTYEDLASIIATVITSLPSPKLGDIMGHLKKNYPNQYDAKDASEIIRAALQ